MENTNLSEIHDILKLKEIDVNLTNNKALKRAISYCCANHSNYSDRHSDHHDHSDCTCFIGGL